MRKPLQVLQSKKYEIIYHYINSLCCNGFDSKNRYKPLQSVTRSTFVTVFVTVCNGL